MAQEAPGQTLQPTALVHEAWLRLAGGDGLRCPNRAYFFAAAGEAMRRILVENARRKKRLNRWGDQQRVDLEGIEIPAPMPDEELLALDEALDRLADSLGKLLEETQRQKIKLSQINLVCRVDDINAHASELVDILSVAQRLDVKIMFASIGFESFIDRMLQYFCKGVTVVDIVKCVETLRSLKDRFGSHFLYRRDEGANHGFIRPTPWDDSETLMEIDRNIFLHRLFEDILPEHSTPLIIHHASHLGDWIRQIESMTDITFSREGTWIEWWNPLLEGAG